MSTGQDVVHAVEHSLGMSPPRESGGLCPNAPLWRVVTRRSDDVEVAKHEHTEEEATIAYDEAAVRLHGKHARLNFDPETGEEVPGQIGRSSADVVRRRKRR